MDVKGIGIGDVLTRNVVGTWGAAGQRWLAELPTQLAGLARDWDLKLGVPFALTFHWVVAATRADGTDAVLKVGLPDAKELSDETAALEDFDGQ